MSNHDELLSSLLGTAKELKQAEAKAAQRPAVVQHIDVGGSTGGTFFDGVKMFASGIVVAVAIIFNWSWVGPMALPYFSWVPWLQVACIEQQGGDVADSNIPKGNPLNDPRTVVTQGYGVGSHAPAEIWGGQDLAIDSNGDGKAEEGPTWNVPVYTTHGGTARVVLNSDPGGNCVFVSSTTHRTTYCHLDEALVADGATVTRGQQIGKVGSTGKSSGPHLHYEVWDKASGREVNVDPAGYGMLEPMTITTSTKKCPVAPVPAGGSNMSVVGPSTISASRMDEVLREIGSPAQGVGAFAVAKGNEEGINAAFWLAFYRQESSYGTNPAWDANARAGRNSGNITCGGYTPCAGGWRQYPTWEAGIEDWFKLIKREYVQGRGLTGVNDILRVYAPFGHGNNNPDAYAASVATRVACWADETIPVRECESK